MSLSNLLFWEVEMNNFKVAVITVSDRSSKGEREDQQEYLSLLEVGSKAGSTDQ